MEPILLADERTLLTGMLDRQREEIAALLDDLTEEEARARLVPSLTTVMGLVKHGRSLDEEYQWRTVRVSLRYVLVHMIQELARHAGHGDVLVEQLHARRPG